MDLSSFLKSKHFCYLLSVYGLDADTLNIYKNEYQLLNDILSEKINLSDFYEQICEFNEMLKEISKIDKTNKKINQINFENYSEECANCIKQLNNEQIFKLKNIICQNREIDERYKNKYGKSKADNPEIITYFSTKFSEPYSFEKINEFEIFNNVELPLELKVYLTCVSSSIYKNHLEYSVIELNGTKNMPTIICNLKHYYETNLNCKHHNDPNYETMLKVLKEVTDTTIVLVIRKCGCDYNDMIILNGNSFGEVWHEKFAEDGEFYKVNNSFFDYVLSLQSN